MSEKWKTNLIKVVSSAVCVSYFPSLFSTSAARISKYEDWTPAVGVRLPRLLQQKQGAHNVVCEFKHEEFVLITRMSETLWIV